MLTTVRIKNLALVDFASRKKNAPEMAPARWFFLYEFQTAIWLADLPGSLGPAAPTT